VFGLGLPEGAGLLEFVERGDFGFASGPKNGGAYQRIWYSEPIGAEEIAFESTVFLLTKAKAQQLKADPGTQPSAAATQPVVGPIASMPGEPIRIEPAEPGLGAPRMGTLRLIGEVPPETWSRLGAKVLPKLRSGSDLRIGIDFSITIEPALARNLESEIRTILKELALDQRVRIERA